MQVSFSVKILFQQHLSSNQLAMNECLEELIKSTPKIKFKGNIQDKACTDLDRPGVHSPHQKGGWPPWYCGQGILDDYWRGYWPVRSPDDVSLPDPGSNSKFYQCLPSETKKISLNILKIMLLYLVVRQLLKFSF